MFNEEYKPDSVELERYSIEQPHPLGSPANLSCPECGGSLWQIKLGKLHRYQCHIGHAFITESLLKNQADEIERHLWMTLRLLKERLMLTRQLAAAACEQQRSPLEIQQIEAEAQQTLQQAELLRQILLNTQVNLINETQTFLESLEGTEE